MERRIIIKNPANDEMGYSFMSFFDILEQLENVERGDHLIIDLRNLTFVHPFLILPLCALLRKFPFSDCIVDYQFNGVTESYLNTILFPSGFDALSRPNWDEYLSKFQTKTYLPICQIPAEVKDTPVRESLLTVFENILLRQLNISGQMKTVFKYLIGEAMDNIVDHSGVQNGWIMVQNYPLKGFLDICILETGIGLLGSYKKFNFPDIETDEQALEQAINGKSTKQITETRGYGIDTSRRMLVDGLKGKYFLLSGSAMYIYTIDFEQTVPLMRNVNWPGTMLALRIPQTVPAGFNYSKYLE
jgi:anti-sigma regulatory factor (Ser/Thr protein kinase)